MVCLRYLILLLMGAFLAGKPSLGLSQLGVCWHCLKKALERKQIKKDSGEDPRRDTEVGSRPGLQVTSLYGPWFPYVNDPFGLLDYDLLESLRRLKLITLVFHRGIWSLPHRASKLTLLLGKSPMSNGLRLR
jgi:hypothetical protein